MAAVSITLLTTAAAVFVNLWLGARVVSSRRQNQVKLGDGGNEAEDGSIDDPRVDVEHTRLGEEEKHP